MFQQFHALKAQAGEAILFFRMGDFYETFFADALVAAEVLDLTLTARNKHDDEPIPMAGVPHHAATAYVQRLVEAGYKVAIAEQVEDPAQAKGLVKREIVRVVTPGVVLDPSGLEASSANWLMALVQVKAKGGMQWGIAALDASTGDFRLTTVNDGEEAVSELFRMEPAEVLLAPHIDSEALRSHLTRAGVHLSSVDAEAWRLDVATRELHEALGVKTLEGFGVHPLEAGVRAAGAVHRYARERLGQKLANVHRLGTWRPEHHVHLDEATRRNLEISKTMRDGRRRGSLLGLLDRTRTAMGGRRLREWVAAPLRDPKEIHERSRAVAALVETAQKRDVLREGLRDVSDIERILARVAQGTAHGRDLAGLQRSLQAVPRVVSAAAAIAGLDAHLPTDLCQDVADDLGAWLVEDPPIALTEGGLLRREAHPELDELVHLALEGHSLLRAMEAEQREATGIPTLKIRQNKVFGYFIEVTRAHLHKVPESYIRKQTLTNAERYITPDLKTLEERLLGADERRKRLEYSLFVALRSRTQEHSERLTALARCLADLDVLSTLAALAVQHRWVRPTVDDGHLLVLEGARHPVVEQMLGDEPFVPNNIMLDGETRQLIVLTGPNMAGKSTVMRQVALLVLMAQIGSFVPATSATIGVVDRIFTRVGASDDLAAGQSTFMVEMAETAAILHHATARSLVVLDEIGRGTSTYDGLSLAWAVAEDLVDRVGCRAMFATHYHELCELADTRPTVVNQHVAVRTSGGEITFLRTLADGGASRSYGIECARLAGLPRAVVQRAKGMLKHFEKVAPRNERNQLSLFSTSVAAASTSVEPEEKAHDALRALLEGVDPDALSPREAHAVLYRLKDVL